MKDNWALHLHGNHRRDSPGSVDKDFKLDEHCFYKLS